VIWSVFEVSQSNSRFNVLERLVIEVNSVKMPVGFGEGIKTKARILSVMAHVKRSIIEIRAEQNCLAHATIVAITKITNDPNYESYRKGYKIIPVVQHLLETTGIDVRSGGVIPELTRFQEHFKDYMIVVYEGLACD
jgi:hypothetical protein